MFRDRCGSGHGQVHMVYSRTYLYYLTDLVTLCKYFRNYEGNGHSVHISSEIILLATPGSYAGHFATG